MKDDQFFLVSLRACVGNAAYLEYTFLDNQTEAAVAAAVMAINYRGEFTDTTGGLQVHPLFTLFQCNCIISICYGAEKADIARCTGLPHIVDRGLGLPNLPEWAGDSRNSTQFPTSRQTLPRR